MLSISQFMDAEHAFLQKLWDDFCAEMERSGPEKAFDELHGFKQHLALHMALEDNFLFPRLSEHLGLGNESAAITQKALDDHGNMNKLLEYLENAMMLKDERLIKRYSEHFGRIQNKHHQREQKIHYPVSDAFINKEEWEEMTDRIYGDALPDY